jgi:hypothetical protein
VTRRECFLWGAFGGLLPEVVRFFKIVQSGTSLPDLNWTLYALFLLLFVSCAGVFSVAWKPESEYKAIWVGASLPALVATLVQAVPKPPGG